MSTHISLGLFEAKNYYVDELFDEEFAVHQRAANFDGYNTVLLRFFFLKKQRSNRVSESFSPVTRKKATTPVPVSLDFSSLRLEKPQD